MATTSRWSGSLLHIIGNGGGLFEGRLQVLRDLFGEACAKTDWQTARLALRSRRETTMTVAWIAQRLHMGSVNTRKNTLRLADSRD